MNWAVHNNLCNIAFRRASSPPHQMGRRIQRDQPEIFKQKSPAGCGLEADVYRKFSYQALKAKLFLSVVFLWSNKKSPPNGDDTNIKSGRKSRKTCGQVVGVGRFELPASWTRTMRATNCATPRNNSFSFPYTRKNISIQTAIIL